MTDASLCPRCHGSVRTTRVIEGRRVHYECYCKRCNYVWQLEPGDQIAIQRRKFSRRRLATRRSNTRLRGIGDRRGST